MTVLADAILRSSALLLAGLAVTACLRGRSAALRHAILATSIAASVAVIPLRLAGPVLAVPVPAPSIAAAAPPVRAASIEHAAGVPTGNAPDGAPRAGAIAAAAWFAGFAATALMLLMGILRVRALARRARPVDNPQWRAAAAGIAARRRIRQPVLLLQTDAADVLATSGILRPRILLPRHARHWSDDRMRAVLSHELAHIERRDWLVQIAAESVRAVFWFNPLLWIACTLLRREAEQACDDVVLAQGVPARDYAAHLVALARLCRTSPSLRSTAMPMAHLSTLERRITAMLAPRLDRTTMSRRLFAITATLVLALALPLAAVRAAQSGPAPLGGSIYDATGAVLPGVEVTLEAADETRWTATSNASGRFDFPAIAAGHYTISTALPGFRALRQEFDLRESRDWDRAITLQVGDLRETITVRERRLPLPSVPTAAPPAPRIRVGGNIRAPRKELDVKPIYPAAMRAAGREGVVPIEAIIGRDGTVTWVRVLSAQVHPDFAIAAVDAVRQWRFSPTLLNGSPVEVVMTVSVAFNLAD